MKLFKFLSIYAAVLLWFPALAEINRIEITERETLSDARVDFDYQSITGVIYFTLDPAVAGNAAITDIAYAPVNSDGLVEYAADFRVLVPSESIANGGLLYNVNNRGGTVFPPERSLQHPLSGMGFTYLATGWINELSPREGRLRLHAPIVGSAEQAITGLVRYEVSVGAAEQKVNIAGAGHLAYEPTATGLREARLSERLYQNDARIPLERSQFQLEVLAEENSNQPIVNLSVNGGFQPGTLYELIYEARNPVLAGAGMAAIRDLVSAIRFGDDGADQLRQLGLSNIENTVAWGNSQSGRLLRQYVYDGFNEDLKGRKVFDGVIPVIAGSGYGMFNNRFAMPTRTNGQHSNHLYPNDLFPFTYDESTDPFTGRTDSILGKARASNTVPKVMHIQTSNEYWVRGGSLPHTNPQGTQDAVLPDEVRFYSIGGSQHGSGNGMPRAATSGQLPPNPNMWAPIADSLLVAMHDWVANNEEPPASRYPRIADGSLVPSHTDGRINPDAWNPLNGVNHPAANYTPGFADYGDRWDSERIIDRHPLTAASYYTALVPAVNKDNNDSAETTILPPLTQVPLATFVPWNLRAESTGAERSLARLSGGYIPLPASRAMAEQARDPRTPITALYTSFDDYLAQYEAATDSLIGEGYLLPGFKQTYMDIARSNRALME
ncbi:MAG: alpha/beta hydrolase domain-containing protein [Pseudohongiellaceae bacterium]